MKARRSMRTLAIALALGPWTAWGAGSGFWIPYAATPVTSSGKSGLFLINSNQVGSSPAPVPSFVTTSEVTLLGATFQGFPGSSQRPLQSADLNSSHARLKTRISSGVYTFCNSKRSRTSGGG
jgi:hypothetical protein